MNLSPLLPVAPRISHVAEMEVLSAKALSRSPTGPSFSNGDLVWVTNQSTEYYEHFLAQEKRSFKAIIESAPRSTFFFNAGMILFNINKNTIIMGATCTNCTCTTGE